MIDITDPAFRSLVGRYVERLREYRARLEAFEREPDMTAETMTEIHGIAHKLAGTATTFGYPVLGAQALALEESLLNDPRQVPHRLRSTIEAIAAADHTA